MINLTEAHQALSNEFEELARLEQDLADSPCSYDQDYLLDKILKCEKVIYELDEEIKLLESEE